MKIGGALSVLLILSTVVGSVLLVKFRVDVLRDDVGDLKSDVRAMQKIWVDLDKTMTVGFKGLEAKIDTMVSGVENAQRVALRAETLAIGQNVEKDFRDNAVQPQPTFGK